ADAAILMMINPRSRQTVKTIFKDSIDKPNQKYSVVHTAVSGWVIKSKCPFLSEDIQADSRFRKQLFQGAPVQSVLGVPLLVRGVVIGTLILLRSSSDQSFDEQDEDFMQRFAAAISPYLRDLQKIQEYFNRPLPEKSLLTKYEAMGLLGKSPKFVELLKAIEAAASTDVRVLLEGQTGTGKELIAKAIHRLSNRSQHKFVAIDCGAIAANLIESELFGHVKGAFTGAQSDRKGLLDEANGGTLFMDEIANLPLEMQTKMMRFLQEGDFRTVGSNKIRKVNVRVISASSSSLKSLVDRQAFREDLFYRLHVYPISVPSLNERGQDIPVLANHFLHKFAQSQQKKARYFHSDILELMKCRQWTGNIRELENFVERLMTLTPAEAETISPNFLPEDIQKELTKLIRSDQFLSGDQSLAAGVAEFEDKVIRQTLSDTNWNQSQAARRLKISEHTLRYKMKKLKIVRP
ncbi:MAG: sigma-54 interaction domain-containing protein, partial [bacterium]